MGSWGSVALRSVEYALDKDLQFSMGLPEVGMAERRARKESSHGR